ncbi:unnamed protein product [Mycena citricolor]|uniref:Uncharacterized protein n=1 Tax=Mycena citricolor TaxID=2018698 RepID=A0AAD2I1G0_9AGAR|nr:unnamed protein product [Mycena citricolor]
MIKSFVCLLPCSHFCSRCATVAPVRPLFLIAVAVGTKGQNCFKEGYYHYHYGSHSHSLMAPTRHARPTRSPTMTDCFSPPSPHAPSTKSKNHGPWQTPLTRLGLGKGAKQPMTMTRTNFMNDENKTTEQLGDVAEYIMRRPSAGDTTVRRATKKRTTTKPPTEERGDEDGACVVRQRTDSDATLRGVKIPRQSSKKECKDERSTTDCVSFPKSPEVPLQLSSHRIRGNVSGARLLPNGCYELDPEEYTLSIQYHSGPHFEFWDNSDNYLMVTGLALCIRLRDPDKWDHIPLARPTLNVGAILCTSAPIVCAPAHYRSSPASKFAVSYHGTTLNRAPPSEDPATWGIVADSVWNREPGCTSGPRVARLLAFMVPMPTKLFDKCETRVFDVSACVSLNEKSRHIVSSMERITVSHLQRERDMSCKCTTTSTTYTDRG